MAELRDLTDEGDLKQTIAGLLRDAEKAHGEFETTLGHRDDDWPVWYADYLISHLPEQE